MVIPGSPFVNEWLKWVYEKVRGVDNTLESHPELVDFLDNEFGFKSVSFVKCTIVIEKIINV